MGYTVNLAATVTIFTVLCVAVCYGAVCYDRAQARRRRHAARQRAYAAQRAAQRHAANIAIARLHNTARDAETVAAVRADLIGA